jgi:hypothetical protein
MKFAKTREATASHKRIGIWIMKIDSKSYRKSEQSITHPTKPPRLLGSKTLQTDSLAHRPCTHRIMISRTVS